MRIVINANGITIKFKKTFQVISSWN